MDQLKKQMKETISGHSIYMLCEMFEITNTRNDSAVTEIRGLIMDELEKRDQQAFFEWIDTDDEDNILHPSKFFTC